MIAMCIIFPMSNWVTSNLGYYIGYMIAEAFAVTGLNLVAVYASPSIPYATAIFVLHCFWALLLGGFFILDSDLFQGHPSVKAVWQWFSWVFFGWQNDRSN